MNGPPSKKTKKESKTKNIASYRHMIVKAYEYFQQQELNKINALLPSKHLSSVAASAKPRTECLGDIRLAQIRKYMDMYPGWAKRMAEMQIIAYKKQYNVNNFFAVRPCNVYGPGDNFDPENAMVIPTLMNRIFKKEDPVVIWGDGSAVRDFAYAGDVADGIILTMIKGTGKYDFLNLGSGNGYSIKELVETLSKVVKFNYKFDASKNSGFPKRVMNINNAKKIIGFNPSFDLYTGLKITWNWFVSNSNQYKKRKNYLRIKKL